MGMVAKPVMGKVTRRMAKKEKGNAARANPMVVTEVARIPLLMKEKPAIMGIKAIRKTARRATLTCQETREKMNPEVIGRRMIRLKMMVKWGWTTMNPKKRNTSTSPPNLS